MQYDTGTYSTIGVRGRAVHWICGFLGNRTGIVNTGEDIEHMLEHASHSGVLASPTLFNLTLAQLPILYSYNRYTRTIFPFDSQGFALSPSSLDFKSVFKPHKGVFERKRESVTHKIRFSAHSREDLPGFHVEISGYAMHTVSTHRFLRIIPNNSSMYAGYLVRHLGTFN